MADTTFTNSVTVTDADWFNDVNRLHYTILSDPADAAAVRTNLGVRGLTLLQSSTASASATIDLTTSLGSTYDSYLVQGNAIIPAVDTDDLWMRVSIASVFATANYKHSGYGNADGGAISVDGSASDSKIKVAVGLGNSTGESCFFSAWVLNPSNTAIYKPIMIDAVQYSSTPAFVRTSRGGMYIGALSAIDGVRIMASTGNITSGNFYLYGLRKT